MSKGSKCQRFHFHVFYVGIVERAQEVELFLFGVVTESAVQATLSC